MAETYKQARERLLRELKDLGWDTKPELKRPWAKAPDGQHKIEFHAQAVYLNGHSMWCDIRGMSVYELMRRTSI